MAASFSTVYITVTSDLISDQRVLKIAGSLKSKGYKMKLIGRKLGLEDDTALKGFAVKRFNLFFNKGFLFYAEFNIRLFIYLLFSKKGIIYSNDLDTLPAGFIASEVKGTPIVYDSHEYFTQVPELINRPKVQSFWLFLEKHIVPRLKNCITVSQSIAEVYEKEYGVKFHIVRNFPLKEKEGKCEEKENTIIYQGALNIGRGLEEIVAAMPFVDADLWLAGGGDIEEELKEQVRKLKLEHKVHFLGRLNAIELKSYTRRARLGLSVEKPLGLNYKYALPNKVFDYIHVCTPVLYSPLIEVQRLLSQHEVGEELESYKPEQMAAQLNKMLSSEKYTSWQKACEKAAEHFNWQREEQLLLSIFDKIF